MNTYLNLGGYTSICGPLVACFIRINKPLEDYDFYSSMCTKGHLRVDDWDYVKKLVDMAFDRDEFTHSFYACPASDLDFLDTYDVIKKALSRAYINNVIDISFKKTIYTSQVGIPRCQDLFKLRRIKKTPECVFSKLVTTVLYKSLLKTIHNKYPIYELDRNSGLPNDKHMQIILENGPCEFHRSNGVKLIPNWITRQLMKTHLDRHLDPSSKKDKVEKYRKYFQHTTHWWGKYTHYSLSMFEALDEKSKHRLRQSFNYTDSDVYLVPDKSMEQWILDTCPSVIEREYYLDLKSKSEEQWKLFQKSSQIQQPEEVKVVHLQKRHLQKK